MRKNIVIIGGKTQSRSLAEILLHKNHRVTVISPDESLCERLREIDGLNVIYGDGRISEVLEDADINQFDIAITMHDHDADNLVTCEMCKKVYGVAKTISVVSDVNRKVLFDAMGVDSVISATNLIAQTLEQQTLSDQLSRIVPTADDRIRISEILVTEKSKVLGKTLADIHLPNQTIIGCIIRNNEVIVPSGSTTINLGDNVLLITTAEKEDEAVKTIAGK
ncbi:MAG: NAD-binding protein [Erysipelotrichaceae bacterium]|nr:NAD-binding protein [Erysipelotrichaceae bacterium]